MNKPKESNLLQYGLSSILTVKYNYILATKKFNDELSELVVYNVLPHVSFNIEHENIIVKIEANAVVKETNEKIMEIETAFAYKIPELKSHVHEVTNDGKKAFEFKDSKNAGLFTVLIGVSYSTMRGIVIERNRGTFLENIYLPIINPSIFTKKQEIK